MSLRSLTQTTGFRSLMRSLTPFTGLVERVCCDPSPLPMVLAREGDAGRPMDESPAMVGTEDGTEGGGICGIDRDPRIGAVVKVMGGAKADDIPDCRGCVADSVADGTC